MPEKESNKSTIEGMLAEFDSAESLIMAAEKIKNAGYTQFDCHSPFPIHGLDNAMGLKRSPLGWIVGIMSFTGAGLGVLLQGWTSAIDYPIIISGKPFFSYQAFIPVTFGLAVLMGAISAFLGMLILTKLPKPHDPIFHSDNFDKMSTDGFFISIGSESNKFDILETENFLKTIGGINVEVLKEK